MGGRAALHECVRAYTVGEITVDKIEALGFRSPQGKVSGQDFGDFWLGDFLVEFIEDRLVPTLLRPADYAFGGGEARGFSNEFIAGGKLVGHLKHRIDVGTGEADSVSSLGLGPSSFVGAKCVILANRSNLILPGDILAFDVFLKFDGAELRRV